ncbi:MAG: hypothetical protein [Circular genetic element sp.]|nr:MAG: hypothetical protein [Circular genetic element sp.]
MVNPRTALTKGIGSFIGYMPRHDPKGHVRSKTVLVDMSQRRRVVTSVAKQMYRSNVFEPMVGLLPEHRTGDYIRDQFIDKAFTTTAKRLYRLRGGSPYQVAWEIYQFTQYFKKE